MSEDPIEELSAKGRRVESLIERRREHMERRYRLDTAKPEWRWLRAFFDDESIELCGFELVDLRAIYEAAALGEWDAIRRVERTIGLSDTQAVQGGPQNVLFMLGGSEEHRRLLASRSQAFRAAIEPIVDIKATTGSES